MISFCLAALARTATAIRMLNVDAEAQLLGVMDALEMFVKLAGLIFLCVNLV